MNKTLTPQRILVIRLSSIGDIVLTTAAIRILKNTFPDAQIDFLIKSQFADLLRYHPAISRIIELLPNTGFRKLLALRRELARQRYDIILDLHKNLRSLLLTAGYDAAGIGRLRKFALRRFLLVQTGLDRYKGVQPVYERYIAAGARFGLKPDGEKTELFLPPELQSPAWLAQTNAKLQPGGYTVLAPGAGYFTKRWPAERFAELARKLAQQGQQICVLGGPQDKELAATICREASESIDLTGKLGLLESAAVVSQAAAVIVNDTGLLHIAEALGKPVHAIFGSTTRQLGFYPILSTSRVYENTAISCRPCSHVGRHSCPKQHLDCLQTIRPDAILADLNVPVAGGQLREREE